ncbi:MAG: kinase/pyrophosphorylase [Bdellovibrionales bacterium]|nr:kinase/pyrophosphorylase [Bdellovibrionales bacterium]
MTENQDKKIYTVYIISDGTGETASTMVRAALVQYHQFDLNIVRCKNVRTEPQVDHLMEDILRKRGLIVFTVVSEAMRRKITSTALSKGIPVVDLMGPLLNVLDTYLGSAPSGHTAGILRAVDERYFKRIEAIEFTVKHDDGKILTDLAMADIILLGISRTSKTPLSVFLSHKGWKVANIPLVVGAPLPPELQKVDQRKIVGLIIDADSLVRIRRKRLEKFGQDPGGEYASMTHIHQEIEFAKNLYKQNKRWPIFDVTDRALEETAAEIVRVVASRMDLKQEVLL